MQNSFTTQSNGKDLSVDSNQEITLTLMEEEFAKLRRAFPESENIHQVATDIAKIATQEFINLLAGEKRYLSLSHQYIEWLEELYKHVLPNEEYTYNRIAENFNFPPGQGAYITRILRSRQYGEKYKAALVSLESKLKREKQTKLETERLRKFKANDSDLIGKTVEVWLSARERDLLKSIVNTLIEDTLNLGKTDIPEFCQVRHGNHFRITIHLQDLESVLEKLKLMV